MLSLKVMMKMTSLLKRKKKSVEEIGTLKIVTENKIFSKTSPMAVHCQIQWTGLACWITMMTQILIIILQMKSYVGFWSMQLVMSFLSYIQCLHWEIYVLPGIFFFQLHEHEETMATTECSTNSVIFCFDAAVTFFLSIRKTCYVMSSVHSY